MSVILTTILLLQSMPGYFGKSNLRRSVFDAPTFSSDPGFVQDNWIKQEGEDSSLMLQQFMDPPALDQWR